MIDKSYLITTFTYKEHHCISRSMQQKSVCKSGGELAWWSLWCSMNLVFINKTHVENCP